MNKDKSKKVNRIKKFWINLPIKFKILSYYFIIIILLFAALTALNRNNIKTLNLLNDTINNNYKVYMVMQDTSQNLKSIERYLFYNDTEALRDYNMRKQELALLIDDLDSVQKTLESYFIINAIYYSTKAYEEKFAIAIAKKQAGNDSYYMDYYEAIDIHKYTDRYFNELLMESLKYDSQRAESINNTTNRTQRTSYQLIFVFGALALILGILLSNYIVRPIKKLSDYSKKISQGELDIREVDVSSEDEIGDLARAYNHMGRNIRDYVERIKEKANIEKKLHEEERTVMQMERNLQQSRLEALQSKINPHFLFNTLNVISRTALFEEANETMDLIQMLSNIFRYQLKSAGEMVSLSEGKVLISDYLKLQSVRFKERLQYEIDIPEEIDIYIPVLILQPLVENAITHGIGDMVEGGKVTVKAYETKNEVTLEVSDNGVGMDKKLVKRINSNTESNSKGGASIGLRNVRDRFLLTYPGRSRFVINSEKNVGTTVRMIIIKEDK